MKSRPILFYRTIRKTPELTRVYQEGVHAFWDLWNEEDNPYAGIEFKGKAWAQGYEDGLDMCPTYNLEEMLFHAKVCTM